MRSFFQQRIICHGTKFEVPNRERFWNGLALDAQSRFFLIGRTNKSWVAKSKEQSELLASAIIRIVIQNGQVQILSSKEPSAVDSTLAFLHDFVVPEIRKGFSGLGTGISTGFQERFRYLISDVSHYRAVVSDDRLVFIPSLNSNQFRDEAPVFEITKSRAPREFVVYNNDIERFLWKESDQVPLDWNRAFEGGRLTESATRVSRMKKPTVRKLRVEATAIEALRSLLPEISDLVLYINSSCNLRCKHCYLGNDLLSRGFSYDADDVCGVIRLLAPLDRLTIIGGEPLLHGQINQIIETCFSVDIKDRRISTNLTDVSKVKLDQLSGRSLTFAVSLDGADRVSHDYIRGIGAFDKTTRNIRTLLDSGCDVEITHTLTAVNIGKFAELLVFLRSIGVRRLNLHRISPQGNANDHAGLQISSSRWMEFCEEIEKIPESSSNSAAVLLRYPPLFVRKAEFQKLVQEGAYWAHRHKSYHGRGQRVVFYPDGKIFISSELFGTEAYIGYIENGIFLQNQKTRHELDSNLLEDDPQFVVNLGARFRPNDEDVAVLSVSFKKTKLV